MTIEFYRFLVLALAAGFALSWLYLGWIAWSRRRVRATLAEKSREFISYREEIEPLRRYATIVDAEAEATRVRDEAASTLREAQSEAATLITEAESQASAEVSAARSEARELRGRAERKLQDAQDISRKIEDDAKMKAEEVAGEAWKAKENAEQYEAAVRAMKNVIEGYGDEYLVPNRSVLDELAEEFDHKEAGRELAKTRTLIKSMIKNDQAAECDYVEPHRKRTAIDFVLDAFNGKVDTVMSKVRHDNYGKMAQQLEDAFRLVNLNGRAFRDARITGRYATVVQDQLRWAVAAHELKRIDQEEQREIKERMREEERALPFPGGSRWSPPFGPLYSRSCLRGKALFDCESVGCGRARSSTSKPEAALKRLLATRIARVPGAIRARSRHRSGEARSRRGAPWRRIHLGETNAFFDVRSARTER